MDDHAAFLQVAAQVIAATPGFESVGESESAAEALALVAARKPDLAIIDLHMPVMDGVELTQRIKAASPPTVALLISADDPSRLPAAAARSGADGYLSTPRFGRAALRRAWRLALRKGGS